jgi:hypothetical protein
MEYVALLGRLMAGWKALPRTKTTGSWDECQDAMLIICKHAHVLVAGAPLETPCCQREQVATGFCMPCCCPCDVLSFRWKLLTCVRRCRAARGRASALRCNLLLHAAACGSRNSVFHGMGTQATSIRALQYRATV